MSKDGAGKKGLGKEKLQFRCMMLGRQPESDRPWEGELLVLALLEQGGHSTGPQRFRFGCYLSSL